MENIFPQHFLDLLMISVTFSFVLMALLQKFKKLPWVTKKHHIWFLNLFFSFALGMAFAVVFYGVSWLDSIWVGVFSFIGAPSLYEMLKNQTILTYKPSSLSDKVVIPKENEIKTEKSSS